MLIGMLRHYARSISHLRTDMEEWILQLIAYGIGTITGLFITRYQINDAIHLMLDNLVDNGFLRHRKDDEGNVVILKYHDNRS